MLATSASSSSLSSNKAGKNGASKRDKAQGSSSGDAATEEDDVLASHLTRPTPDAILADEADPDTLLGDESDSDAGDAVKRVNKANSSGKKTKSSGSSKPSDVVAANRDALEPSPNKRDYRRSRQLFDASEVAAAMDGANSSSPTAPGRAGMNGHSDSTDDEKSKDLRTQVTGLNNKLVVSFERIGDLEDDLSQKQEELKAARAMIERLEKERGEHLAALNTGLLVEKEHVSNEMQKMMERLVQETAEKGKAVDERAKIEAELDDLSSSLFAEANKMVAVEKLARARAEEKSTSMEERLRDTEEIMEQQSKRLMELQGALELAEAKASQDDEMTLSEPSRERRAPRISMGPAQNASASGVHLDHLTPLAGGQLRLDIVPYIELRTFLNHLRKLRLQLAPFYSYNSIIGEDGTSQPSTPTIVRHGSPAPPQPSTFGAQPASPFAAADVPRHKDFPSLPANVEQLVHLPTQVSSLSFLKRLNEEDAEPCLRLDFAPGLNWLSRRQMHSAILEGNLMIEPIFGGGIYNEEEVRAKATGSAPAACAMCGRLVVNVPLPGGGVASDVSGWASAASTLQASVGGFASSLPGRDSTASPPLGSGLFSSSNSTSSSKDTPTPSAKGRNSIFSTLRSISSGSGRSSSGYLSTGSGGDSITQQQQALLVANIASNHPEDPWAGRLAPIPTHIFRISETSSARYLLCPDFCLRRLRATCDLWGYVRALERAVVLEGKFAFDDEHQHSQPSQQKTASAEGDVATVTEIPTQASDEVKAVDTAAQHDEDIVDTSGDGHDSASASPTERSPKHIAALEGDSAAPSTATNSDSESMHSAADQDGETEKSSGGQEEEADRAQDDHTLHGTEARDLEENSKDTEPSKAENERPVVPQKDGAPKLPPRTVIAAPVPVIAGQTQPESPRALGPEPRRLLDTADPDKPAWEEKVWLEINRLRADLWAARVGVVHPDML